MLIKAISYDAVKEQLETQANDMLGVPPADREGEDCVCACIDELFDEFAIVEMSETYWQVPYTVDMQGVATLAGRETWQTVTRQTNWIPIKGLVQAVKNEAGDWLIDVRAVPFGGPFNGKDHDGEYFDPNTKTMLDDPAHSVLIAHYHGYDESGNPADEPAFVGREVSREKRQDGWWLRVSLDKASDKAKDLWEAAKNNTLRASSGAIQHLVRPLTRTARQAQNGYINIWPVAELSLMDISKGTYPANPYAVAMPVLQKRFKAANIKSTIIESEASAETQQGAETPANEEAITQLPPQEIKMTLTLEEIGAYLDKRDADKAEANRIKDLEAKAAELDTLKAQIAQAQEDKSGREQIKKLPNPVALDAPSQITVNSKWDGFTLGELGMAYDMLKARGTTPSAGLYRALHAKALKTIDAPDFYDKHIARDGKGNIKREFSRAETEAAVKAVHSINPMQLADTPATKSNELMYSTYSNYGDQWVPSLWSPELWDLVRNGADVLGKFRQIEVPGESLTLPTLAGKTTLYKTSQTANQSSLTLTSTVATMSKATTSNVTLTPVKGTAWIEWTGELTEDSIVPILPTLQSALQMDIAEQLDEIVISGDTDTTTANISDYGNAAISTAWYLLIANGLRDHALANSNKVDIGALNATSFLSVLRKMGTNGVNALKPHTLFWVLDPGTYHTALALGEGLTAEKRGSGVGTFEDGLLTRLYGSQIVISDRYGKTDSSGYVNNTGASNTKGSFLAVRPDRWIAGFSRRITIEALPRDRVAIVTDTNGLFASFRFDLQANGTGGAALGYDVTLIG